MPCLIKWKICVANAECRRQFPVRYSFLSAFRLFSRVSNHCADRVDLCSASGGGLCARTIRNGHHTCSTRGPQSTYIDFSRLVPPQDHSAHQILVLPLQLHDNRPPASDWLPPNPLRVRSIQPTSELQTELRLMRRRSTLRSHRTVGCCGTGARGAHGTRFGKQILG